MTVTLSLRDLGDAAGGPGSDLFNFDTNIGINASYLSFLGGFVLDPSSPFTTPETTATATTISGMRVAYDVGLGTDVNASGGALIPLGSFVVHVGSSGLPVGGTSVTLGSASTLPTFGGSEVTNGAGFPFSNVLTGVVPVTLSPTPEPSSLLVLALGMAWLGLMTWRKRSQLEVN